MTGSKNMASLPATDRALIEAGKQACLIRWKCRELKGKERQAEARRLLAAVAEDARDAVVAALARRAGSEASSTGR